MLKEKDRINKIFQIFSANAPSPQTELAYINNFTLTVSVILSAQATDISVNKATKSLFEICDNPTKLLELGEENLKSYIRSIGLYNAKAKNIIALCRILVDKYNSMIPDNFEELIKLPGVGQKTANVILNCAFNRPTVAVDTHVYRVAHRLEFSDGNTPSKVEKDLLEKIPVKWLGSAHHWLILHGRYICKARTPNCSKCSISAYCPYYLKNNMPEIERKNI